MEHRFDLILRCGTACAAVKLTAVKLTLNVLWYDPTQIAQVSGISLTFAVYECLHCTHSTSLLK